MKIVPDLVLDPASIVVDVSGVDDRASSQPAVYPLTVTRVTRGKPADSTAPNLVMAPAQSSADFETLIKDMGNGIAFRSLQATVDFQQLNGLGMGSAYEVRNGKVVARYLNAGVLFRTPELWKNIMGIGGAQSATSYGQMAWKGEPGQVGYHTVTAVPALIKDVSVVDILRRS